MAKRKLVRAAKTNGSNAGLQVIAEQSGPSKRYKRVFDNFDTEEEKESIEPIYLFATKFPKLLACHATDAGIQYNEGQLYLGMKGASASSCRAAMLDAWIMRNLVYKFDYDLGFDPNEKPRFTFFLRFDLIQECDERFYWHDDKDAQVVYAIESNFSMDDTDRFEFVMANAKNLDALRKAIQAQYDIGITERMKRKLEPDLATDVVIDLIEKHLSDGDARIKQIFLDIMNDTSPNGLILRRQQSIRGGSFFNAIRSCIAAWWLPFVASLGLSSSHSYMPFNKKIFDDLLARSGNRRRFLAEYILATAAYDGSIKPTYFRIILPYSDQEEGHSLKDTIIDAYEELFGFRPSLWIARTKVKDGKDIIYLTNGGANRLATIGRVLLPYADEYLSRDRMECLRNYDRKPPPATTVVSAQAVAPKPPPIIAQSSAPKTLLTINKENNGVASLPVVVDLTEEASL